MGTIVSATEARRRLGALLDRVTEGGETIAITRCGQIVATLMPVGPDRPHVPGDDPLFAIMGLCKDCPEVCDAIDEIYEARREERSRPVPDPLTGELEK